jgi:hypothetical protein
MSAVADAADTRRGTGGDDVAGFEHGAVSVPVASAVVDACVASPA